VKEVNKTLSDLEEGKFGLYVPFKHTDHLAEIDKFVQRSEWKKAFYYLDEQPGKTVLIDSQSVAYLVHSAMRFGNVRETETSPLIELDPVESIRPALSTEKGSQISQSTPKAQKAPKKSKPTKRKKTSKAADRRGKKKKPKFSSPQGPKAKGFKDTGVHLKEWTQAVVGPAGKGDPRSMLELNFLAKAGEERAVEAWKKLKTEILTLPTKSNDELKLQVGDHFIFLPEGAKFKLPKEEGAQVLLTTHAPSQKIDPDSPPPSSVVIKRVQEGYQIVGQVGDTDILPDPILSPGQGIRVGKFTVYLNEVTGRFGLLELD